MSEELKLHLTRRGLFLVEQHMDLFSDKIPQVPRPNLPLIDRSLTDDQNCSRQDEILPSAYLGCPLSPVEPLCYVEFGACT